MNEENLNEAKSKFEVCKSGTNFSIIFELKFLSSKLNKIPKTINLSHVLPLFG